MNNLVDISGFRRTDAGFHTKCFLVCGIKEGALVLYSVHELVQDAKQMIEDISKSEHSEEYFIVESMYEKG